MKNLSARHDGFVTPTNENSSHLRHIQVRARNGEVELHAEALLNPSDNATLPPVLLLSPAEAPGSRWPQPLLSGLAKRSAGAVWFDTRDCGRSSWASEPYSLNDLAADAIAVLDELDIETAVVLGQSMGGEVAQRIAVEYSERVQSMVLLSSTPGRASQLAPPEEWLIDKMTERLFEDQPEGDENRALWLAEQQEWFAGPVFGFDRETALASLRAEVASMWRGTNFHGHAVVEAEDIRPRLREVSTRTLVAHGTADPVYPVAHAEALAELVPAARLALIEGLGHELPSGFVATLIDLVIDHASS